MTTRIEGMTAGSTHAKWRLRAVAIEAALIANVGILIAGRVATGEYPIATTGGDDQSIGFVPVIIVTLLTGLAAWGLLTLLERTTARAATIWTAIAIGIFALSLLGPFGSGAGTASKVVLASMHVASAALIIPLMRRSAAR